MTAQTTWPEDVIARYLNVGGATVDIATTIAAAGFNNVPHADGGIRMVDTVNVTFTATCTGCSRAHDATHLKIWRRIWEEVHAPAGAAASLADRATEWAQAHAETCRAMPRHVASLEGNKW
nr:hypothetical protein OG513_18370 [Streptomyces sp. NBC_00998]